MAADESPDRMSITNLDTAKSVTAQFNPDEVKEVLKVLYHRLPILGLSHQPMQYQGTENLKVTFTLGFDALSHEGSGLMDARAFLMSLCYSSRVAEDIIGGDTPPVLLVWPELYALECKMASLSTTLKRFRARGRPTLFTSDIEVERVSEVRLFSEDILTNATLIGG